MKCNTTTWAHAAGVRAVKTVAQTAVATIGTSAVFSEVDWMVVVSAALLGTAVGIVSAIRIITLLSSTVFYLVIGSVDLIHFLRRGGIIGIEIGVIFF